MGLKKGLPGLKEDLVPDRAWARLNPNLIGLGQARSLPSGARAGPDRALTFCFGQVFVCGCFICFVCLFEFIFCFV